MSQFRVKQPMSKLDVKKAIDLQTFTDNAETHIGNKVDIDINNPPVSYVRFVFVILTSIIFCDCSKLLRASFK